MKSPVNKCPPKRYELVGPRLVEEYGVVD